MSADARPTWAGALALLAWLAALGAPPAARAEEEAPVEMVVLLHGLLRTDRSMGKLERHLAEAGYRVENIRYTSRRAPDELVEDLRAELERCCAGAARIHFVTHSLGGILLRAYLAQHELPTLGRVVMLAPPNHGSEYVDRFRDWKWFQWVFGPTGVQLGTDPQSLPNRLPPVRFELGVIAGTSGINPLSAFVMPDGSDGTVSLASARIDGMQDFVTVPVSHSFIMYSDLTVDLTLEFLRSGRFAPR